MNVFAKIYPLLANFEPETFLTSHHLQSNYYDFFTENEWSSPVELKKNLCGVLKTALAKDCSIFITIFNNLVPKWSQIKILTLNITSSSKSK